MPATVTLPAELAAAVAVAAKTASDANAKLAAAVAAAGTTSGAAAAALDARVTALQTAVATLKTAVATLQTDVAKLQLPPVPGPPPPAPEPPPPPAPVPVPPPPPAPPPPPGAKVGERVMAMLTSSNGLYADAAWQAKVARARLVVLGFWRGWTRGGIGARTAVQKLKSLNPRLIVGQYTVMTECVDNRANTSMLDIIDKLDAMQWWLRNAAGAKTQYTSAYEAWDINATDWTPPDANGDRFPQWLAKRDNAVHFAAVPEFDVWYFDNVMTRCRTPQADWRREGVNVSSGDPGVIDAWRKGQSAHWAAARALQPGLRFCGNVDSGLAEHQQELDGAFLEGQAGRDYSLENQGWAPMWARYRDVSANVRDRTMVWFNVWGSASDYRTMRYALATALLGDGMFAFTDSVARYGSVPWFDEYDQALGGAVEGVPTGPASGSIWRRNYEGGMALVNTSKTSGASIDLSGLGLRAFQGAQDSAANNGQPVTTLALAARDGRVLVRG